MKKKVIMINVNFLKYFSENEVSETTLSSSNNSLDDGNESVHSGEVGQKRSAEKNTDNGNKLDKRRRYTLQLRMSEKEAGQVRHKEKMEKFETICELKRQEIKMRKEKNEKQLAITEEIMREKNDLKRKDLALKELKYKFLYEKD